MTLLVIIFTYISVIFNIYSIIYRTNPGRKFIEARKAKSAEKAAMQRSGAVTNSNGSGFLKFIAFIGGVCIWTFTLLVIKADKPKRHRGRW